MNLLLAFLDGLRADHQLIPKLNCLILNLRITIMNITPEYDRIVKLTLPESQPMNVTIQQAKEFFQDVLLKFPEVVAQKGPRSYKFNISAELVTRSIEFAEKPVVFLGIRPAKNQLSNRKFEAALSCLQAAADMVLAADSGQRYSGLMAKCHNEPLS